jgi:hypothetical protein
MHVKKTKNGAIFVPITSRGKLVMRDGKKPSAEDECKLFVKKGGL